MDEFKVLLSFVSEDGTEPLFSAAATYVPRAGDTVTYSMEAPADERQAWNDEVWNDKKAVSGKEWTVVRVHHDFRKFSVRTAEHQVLYVYVRPNV
jgi:hypothetical protein